MHGKPIVMLGIVLALSEIGYAQAQSDTKDQGDVSALRNDVRELQAQQQQIMARLDELKQLLEANGGRPAAPSSADVRGEIFRGSAEARVAIIEYADYECPYCGEYERNTFPQILSDYINTGKVKYFYRDMPLPMHPRAMPAARAARCAGDQGKYWEMHDSLFATQNALSVPALLDRAQKLGLDSAKFSECLSSDKFTAEIQKSISDAQKMGVEGTPTFFIGTVGPDGVMSIGGRIKGTAPYTAFQSAIGSLLTKPSRPVSEQHSAAPQ